MISVLPLICFLIGVLVIRFLEFTSCGFILCGEIKKRIFFKILFSEGNKISSKPGTSQISQRISHSFFVSGGS